METKREAGNTMAAAGGGGAIGLLRSPGLQRAADFLRRGCVLYLASALCMLAGCYVLASSLSGAGREARLARVLALLGALNVYEFLLIGLACYLIRARGLLREGRRLLLLEVLFLVDGTNLLAEAFALKFSAGLWINLAALALAGAKAAVVVRVLRLRVPAREAAAAALALAGMLALPGALAAWNRTGASMPLPIHAGWWLAVALVVAVATLLPRHSGRGGALEETLPRALPLAACGSLAVHLVSSYWVHASAPRLSDLSPALLAGTGALVLQGWGRIRAGQLRAAAAGAATLALVFAAAFPPELTGDLFGIPGLVFSPLRAALVAAAALALVGFALGRRLSLVALAAAALLAACGGHSVPAIAATYAALALALLPRTAAQWGLAALGAAFAFLGAGAALSLLCGREPRAEAGGGPQPGTTAPGSQAPAAWRRA
jgi:hypothetical protein